MLNFLTAYWSHFVWLYSVVTQMVSPCCYELTHSMTSNHFLVISYYIYTGGHLWSLVSHTIRIFVYTRSRLWNLAAICSDLLLRNSILYLSTSVLMVRYFLITCQWKHFSVPTLLLVPHIIACQWKDFIFQVLL